MRWRPIEGIKRASHFIRDEIWRIRLTDLPARKSFTLRNLKVTLLAIRGFDEDKCQLRASALTFYTLLSIVPIFAMAFGIAKGFGFEDLLEEKLITTFPEQEEVIDQIIGFSRSLLENTKGGIITGIGIIVLFWSVIKVLGNIERSFNDIWGVKKSRSLDRKFADYLSVMLVAPITVILTSGMTVTISSQLPALSGEGVLQEATRAFISLALKVLPFCLLWSLFSFIYIFVPNIKVRFASGFLAGIVAGTGYAVAQWIYINFQIGLSRYGTIYGSFAALPLFLIWLQTSWLIVLFGAEISFAHQNIDTYEFEPESLSASPSTRRLVSLGIVRICVEHFAKGEDPITATQISQLLRVPIRLTRDLINDLVNSGILSDTRSRQGKDPAYQPARDINLLTISNVLEALDQSGPEEIPLHDSEELRKIARCLQTRTEAFKGSDADIALKDV